VASPAGSGIKATYALRSVVRLPIRRKAEVVPIRRAA
jgi:hypothetical protein